MRTRHPIVQRSLLILRTQQRLQAESSPRLQMSLIAGLTGLAGLLASAVMLHHGVDSMAWRYPLALGVAYVVFLMLVTLWLQFQTRERAGWSGADLPTPSSASSSPASPEAPFASQQGGDFGGGGASGSFEGPPSLEIDLAGDIGHSPLHLLDAGDAVEALAEADELAAPFVIALLAVSILAGLAFVGVYVVYLAPALFAEVLVDGALSYALYRHVQREDAPHWLATAIRRSLLPFVFTGLILSAVGAGLAHHAPGARSMGEVIHSPAAKPKTISPSASHLMSQNQVACVCSLRSPAKRPQ